jgi:D-aspartate ligase
MIHPNKTDSMKQSIKTIRPPVFLFEMIDHGYAIGKSLHEHGIKTVGFFPSGKSFEYFSRIPIKKYVTPKNNQQRFDLLISAAKEFTSKPVLIINNESFYPFIYEYLNELKHYFSFELPNKTILNLLLEKDLFNEFALNNHIRIPISIEISNQNQLAEHQFSHLQYPLVIKPKYRSPEWTSRYQFRKAFVTQTPEESLKICNELFDVVDRLVVQEWIPGPDSNVYYCLTYLTEEGQFLETFCGQKIHQHPLLFGNTSSAIPIENETIKNETLRILKLSGTTGFCSVEFKKHERTGEYYVIEPTVGRIDRQQYSSSVSNRDVVLSAYCHLANIPLIRKRLTDNNFIYMEESLQLKSYLDYCYYKSDETEKFRQIIKRRKVKFMHLTIKDPITSLLVIGGLVKHLLHYLIKGSTVDFQEDEITQELMSNKAKKMPVYQIVE